MTLIDKAEVQSAVRAYLVHESSEIAQNVEQIIAALPARGVGATWHPFDTAPRDGSRFLAQGGGLDAVDICSYSARVGCWDCGSVTLDDTDHEPEGYNRPAQWMPLDALAPTDAPDLSDPVTVHANMLRGSIAKPTVEQIVHLYGREAFQPMIDASIAKALEKACLAVSEHADWPEDEHGRTEQGGLFARVINAIRGITPALSPALAPTDAAQAQPAMRLETVSENIARDMVEGRFPARSEPQMVPAEHAAHVNETPKSEHDGADVLTAAQAREAAFLGVCECGMTGPCMWDQCQHPITREART